MAYFRLTPVKSLNWATSIFGHFDFSDDIRLRKSSQGVTMKDQIFGDFHQDLVAQ